MAGTDPVFYAHVDGAVAIRPDGGTSGAAADRASRRPPPRCRRHGPRWPPTIADYITASGEYIDFSRFEAVVQALDPPFGSEGQAAVGLKTSSELWRGRPRNQQIYPIFACKDGHVRICLLSPRQWRGMRTWLGEPEQFADPKFDTIAARYAASRRDQRADRGICSPTQTMGELVTEGQRRGVPVAAVLTPGGDVVL